MPFALSLAQLADLCRRYGKMLSLPDGIDPVKLLWALAGKESSFGRNAVPRHEQAYCYAGRYYAREASLLYGCLAHCSYGPWQLMFANVTPGFSPNDLMRSLEIVTRLTVYHINRMVIGEQPKTIEQIAMAYNAGKFEGDALSDPYAVEVAELYKNPTLEMPA